ncbi:hypothetical protein GQ44DRAFT_753944 [Phaeosphaeriaceae sp. PMI808]|nr:hypothetical protein GQ44DRAFT_753944 [Phaeosphaeriaceae sp. PMI808]
MADLQANLYVCIGITWFAALAALVMRVTARRMTRIEWWFDDYFCVFAFLWASGYCAILIAWAADWYLGKIIPPDVSKEHFDQIYYYSRKLGFFNSICYASSLACSKISILSFYWRLFKTSIIRIPILVTIVISSMWWIIRTFMLTFRCVPTAAIWNKNIKDAVCNIDGNKFFLGTITTHFLLDVIILVLPVLPVVNLRLRASQKAGIVGFFLIGVIVCVASCIVLVILITYPAEHGQYPYDYTTFCIWGAVEVNIAIVSACCPLLRPLGRRFLPTVFSSAARYGSQPLSRPSKAIKMSTIAKTELEKEGDDNSSTRQFAHMEDGNSDDYGHHENTTGIQTMISSESDHAGYQDGGDVLDRDGIRVRMETTVEVNAI